MMLERFNWSGPGYYAASVVGDQVVTEWVCELEVLYPYASNIARSRNLGTVAKCWEKPNTKDDFIVIDVREEQEKRAAALAAAQQAITRVESLGVTSGALKLANGVPVGRLPIAQKQPFLQACQAAGLKGCTEPERKYQTAVNVWIDLWS